MTTYVIRRLLQTVVLLFFATVFFFLVVHALPYGPCGSPPSIVCRTEFALDQPVTTQYLIWIGHLLHGNLGESAGGQSISGEIAATLPLTVLLVGVSLLLQQLIAIPLGMLAALRQYSFFDQLLTFFSYSALSIPSFVLGMVLIYAVGVNLNLLPTGKSGDVSLPIFWTAAWFHALAHHPALILGDLLRHLVLPGIALTAGGVAVDSRFMRTAMLNVLHEDYIRTAQANGLRRRRIIFKHMFRNAVLPVVTNLGLYLPTLIGGVVVVEAVFAWGGLGYAFYAATGRAAFVIQNGVLIPGISSVVDVPFLQTVLLLATLAVLIANLLADLTYAWLDPRIRFDAPAGD